MILSGFVFDGTLVGAEGQCPPLNPGGGLWGNKAALIKEVNQRLVVCINRERPAKQELVKPLYAIDDGESLLIQLGVSRSAGGRDLEANAIGCSDPSSSWWERTAPTP